MDLRKMRFRAFESHVVGTVDARMLALCSKKSLEFFESVFKTSSHRSCPKKAHATQENKGAAVQVLSYASNGPGVGSIYTNLVRILAAWQGSQW